MNKNEKAEIMEMIDEAITRAGMQTLNRGQVVRKTTILHSLNLPRVKMCLNQRRILDLLWLTRGWRCRYQLSSKAFIVGATNVMMHHINEELASRSFPVLVFDAGRGNKTVSSSWDCSSLLTALYMMLYLDISSGVVTKRYPNCSRYFTAGKSSTAFCSVSCQNTAKIRSFRSKE